VPIARVSNRGEPGQVPHRRVVVTDYGPSFTSEEFHTFMSHNGIVHVATAPTTLQAVVLLNMQFRLLKRAETYSTIFYSGVVV